MFARDLACLRALKPIGVSICRCLVTAFAIAGTLSGCAIQRQPMSESDVAAMQSSDLRPDEAIVVIRLRDRGAGPRVTGLTFHHDALLEGVKQGAVRSPSSWSPMFILSGQHGERSAFFRVRAGTFSLTYIDFGYGQRGEVDKEFWAYAKPQTITYVGDVVIRNDSTRYDYQVSETQSTLPELQEKYPALFAKYPSATYLFRRDARAAPASK